MKRVAGIWLIGAMAAAPFTSTSLAQLPDASSGKPTANMPQSGPVTLPGEPVPVAPPANPASSAAPKPRAKASPPPRATVRTEVGAPPKVTQKVPQIVLPEMLAVELPRGAAQIGSGDARLRTLLAGATCDNGKVTTQVPPKIGVGTVPVTWNCWLGAVGSGKPDASRIARIFILPAGMVPVGVSKEENATGGNNAVHVARDSTGRLHMVWQYSSPGAPAHGAVYRRASVTQDGELKFETEQSFIGSHGDGDWNGFPALAVSGTNVQLVWQEAGTAHTRRITPGANGYTMGPVIDTGAASGGHDVGASVALDAKGGVHIATPGGYYAYSADGAKFRVEKFPLPPDSFVKTESIAVDADGAAHIAFTAPINRPKPLGGYWQLRTVARAPEGWRDATDVLAGAPGWSAPQNTDDVLADWVRILADRRGGLHLSWHGTTFSRKYANDTAFYSYRKPGGGWSAPLAMMRKDPARGVTFSYAPSLALDGNDVRAMVFYQVQAGGKDVGFDSVLARLRNGRLEGPMLPVTQFVAQAVAAKRPDDAIGSRFPALAPEAWRGGGHAFLDVLQTFQTTGEPGGANIIVYRRLDAGGH